MKFFKHHIVSILIFGIFISACSKEETTAIPAQPVNTITAKSENIPLRFSYPAKLVSDYDVIIKPQVSGVII